MSTSLAASLEVGETRFDSPTSTFSGISTLPADGNHEDASTTPPTSIGGDSHETSSQTGKQDSPENTIAQQPLTDVAPEKARATKAMPPPPPPPPPATPASTRSMRTRTLKEGDLDFDAKMRQLSGHKKRGPRRSSDVVKQERDAATARHDTLSNIPAFVEDNSDKVNGDSAAQPSASGLPNTPIHNNDSGLRDVDMSAQGNMDEQSDAADGNDSTTKRACRISKGEKDAIVEAENLKRKEAKLQKKLQKASDEVKRIQEKLNMIKQGEDLSKNTATPSPRKLKREVKRLEDTKEYKKIEEDVIVVEEIWSRGKKIIPGQPQPTRKSRKAQTEEAEVVAVAEKPKEVEKQKFTYRTAGIFAGTESRPQERTFLPLPRGKYFENVLTNGRDFALPYAICSPVVGRGHPKPENWTNCSKNRFIGEALTKWKNPPKNMEDSRCECSPEGCDESCHNHIMGYECNDDSCRVGRHCGNRPFVDLADRTAKGGHFEIGIQVVPTGATGFGVRSLRGFRPGQIIVEYCGEIITEEECDRRMNECYKNDPCYYLMSFEQNMIIDAARRGSVARFVNHSCAANCEMKKVVVRGTPRMALFAVKEIATGEELTYDYNFHTFSQINRQKCHCGAQNCRGWLMPKIDKKKGKESQTLLEGAGQAVRGGLQAVAKTAKGAANGLKTATKALKRKANEIFPPADEEDESAAVVKKRKTLPPQSSAKKTPLGAATNLSTKNNRRKSAAETEVMSLTPSNTRSFLGEPKANGATGEKKQTKLIFFSSSALSSAAATPAEAPSSRLKRKASESLSPLNDDDSRFFVQESGDEQDEDDLGDVPEGMINVIRPAPGYRKPLPSAPPLAAQGHGGNRLRLVVNPSPGSSAPGSGRTSREASPEIPIVSAKQDLINSKKPRWRAVMNKTPFVQPPAPPPGGPPVPKRIRPKKRASGGT